MPHGKGGFGRSGGGGFSHGHGRSGFSHGHGRSGFSHGHHRSGFSHGHHRSMFSHNSGFSSHNSGFSHRRSHFSSGYGSTGYFTYGSIPKPNHWFVHLNFLSQNKK